MAHVQRNTLDHIRSLKRYSEEQGRAIMERQQHLLDCFQAVDMLCKTDTSFEAQVSVIQLSMEIAREMDELRTFLQELSSE